MAQEIMISPMQLKGGTPEQAKARDKRVAVIEQAALDFVDQFTTATEGSECIAALCNALVAAIMLAPDDMRGQFVASVVITLGHNFGEVIAPDEPQVKH